ncbi:hypothetical protein B0H11DRAFT_2227957 [Mycena galericulata]|nr:hypothetical protein B0H11DRAFT_2227957 [Mycena galericulata]
MGIVTSNVKRRERKAVNGRKNPEKRYITVTRRTRFYNALPRVAGGRVRSNSASRSLYTSSTPTSFFDAPPPPPNTRNGPMLTTNRLPNANHAPLALAAPHPLSAQLTPAGELTLLGLFPSGYARPERYGWADSRAEGGIEFGTSPAAEEYARDGFWRSPSGLRWVTSVEGSYLSCTLSIAGIGTSFKYTILPSEIISGRKETFQLSLLILFKIVAPAVVTFNTWGASSMHTS